MQRSIRNALLSVSAALALAGAALAERAAPAVDQASPAVNQSAPAAEQAVPIESNAERAKTQPGNNAPFWRAVRNWSPQPDTTSAVSGIESTVLIQPFVQYPGSRFTTAGEAWRQVRNQWIIPYGSALLGIVALAIALFHWRKGPIGQAENSGRAIERFTYFERAAHWANALAFCVLAISGIVMAFGKFFLLPLVGGVAFGWLSYALKTAHNIVGPLFAVSLLIVFFTFLRSNWPRREDITWLRKAGGLFGGKEVPSHRFNAGEKVVFWGGVLLLGSIVVGSGLVLDRLIPNVTLLRSDVQVAHMIHAGAAVLMMAMFAGHIYIGTIGMRGAYRAMRDGDVDEGWAREHHALWYEDIEAGKIAAQRSEQQPREAVVRG
ncbi:formate dehydrogenase subunit gamma [Variovorax sp. RA8]|uniref:formate dehydrogenase subunit gamma n=1 Tax=Variovorax sp. (strain JCM 16519 / RA8) TaxID=662548 RepID=UPI0013164FB6|nr:formate dehydrogenase subunit gamma [Variovorax sp. RA8]VTU44866.1 Formate dehydrogenase-O subunit gamma [Variovorax sp. RA8]